MAKSVAAKDMKLSNQGIANSGRRRTPPDVSLRDDCVAYALSILWDNLDEHIQDKLIFPRVVSCAVGHIVAEMVQMVSIGHIQYMKSWKYDVDGRVPGEWDLPEEPALPPIDSWARKVIPIKIASSSESDLYTEAEQVSNLNEQKEISKRPTSMSSAKIQEDRFDSSTRTKQQGPEKRPIEGTLFPHAGSKGGMRTHQVKSCKMTRSNVDGKNKKRNNSETRSASQQDLLRQETEVCLPKSALSYHYPSTMGTHIDAGMKTSQAVEANDITAMKEKIAGKKKALVSMDLHSSRAQRRSAKAHSTGSLSRGRAGGEVRNS